MQGAIYFPFIAVPASAWWTRTMLYWDFVGTIVPREYLFLPDMLDPYTGELVRAGLVAQISPEEAGEELAWNFERYLHGLSRETISRRRENFHNGRMARIHSDKWMSYMSGLNQVRRLGLATGASRWIEIESETACEFMAALALALCHAGETNRRLWADTDRHVSWVPTTDRVEALDAILSGLCPQSNHSYPRRLGLRVRGEVRASTIRTDLLERLLPVPTEQITTEKLLRFRKRHGALLPQLRRHLEEQLDQVLLLDDEELRFRKLDRIAEEAEERVLEAEAYLRELGLKKIVRSSILRAVKFVPLLKDPIENAQDWAASMRTNPDFEAQPLAYLAFARATFVPSARYVVDPKTGLPLAEAMTMTRGESES